MIFSANEPPLYIVVPPTGNKKGGDMVRTIAINSKRSEVQVRQPFFLKIQIVLSGSFCVPKKFGKNSFKGVPIFNYAASFSNELIASSMRADT